MDRRKKLGESARVLQRAMAAAFMRDSAASSFKRFFGSNFLSGAHHALNQLSRHWCSVPNNSFLSHLLSDHLLMAAEHHRLTSCCMVCCAPDFLLTISSDSHLDRQNSSSQGPGGSELELIEHSSASPSQAAPAAASHASPLGNNRPVSHDGAPITIPVHGVVLAAASPYFETLLRDWKSSSNALQMIVSEDQIPAQPRCC